MPGCHTRRIGVTHDAHGKKALFTMGGAPPVVPTLMRGHRFIMLPMQPPSQLVNINLPDSV